MLRKLLFSYKSQIKDLEGFCFVCSEKLGWGNRFDSTHIVDIQKGIVPKGMPENEKICSDCLKITPEEDEGTLEIRREICNMVLELKEDGGKNFDDGKCGKYLESFTYNVISLIESVLKKELDQDYLVDYCILSAQCISHFGKFWKEHDTYYFECPNVTLDFKKYNEYILEMIEDHEDASYAKDDQVWLVLVSTIFLMSMSVTRNGGELTGDALLELNMNLDQLVRKIESFLKKFKLPVKSVRPKKLKKSKNPKGVITKEGIKNNFEDYTWQDMENMVGELFEKKGYEVTVTQATGDFGIDVEARNEKESIGIQVKHWNADVGYEDIAKTLGSSMGKFNRSIVINSKSGFTSQAWQKQSEMPYVLELWDSNKLKSEIKKAFFDSTKTSQNGKFCTQCGTKNVDKAKFCNECGESLKIIS
jgi:HJR/Mrr/RecB family endonuclease